MRTKSLSLLLKKREQLECEIEAAQQLEKRKSEIIGWPEFAKILSLPDEILRTSLTQIAAENLPAN
ncbi:MAG: hypothetical protein PHE17_20865 [Thiothrix sp.]|uniref:hypothetical protein n=1 Tax=Thiothrix sp. TaxID=1032 RepID=UPI00263111F8|nr:hypothetical protein [Thiothrix sp.]MDD5395483.1 hypothetical protein [Thiothrix sp.]